jgi:hypothetical protein
MSNSVKQFVAQGYFEGNIEQIVKTLSMFESEYKQFVVEIEAFFNSQLEDIDAFQDDIIELSDADEKLFFTFKKENGKLKLLESDNLKTHILLAIHNQTNKNFNL